MFEKTKRRNVLLCRENEGPPGLHFFLSFLIYVIFFSFFFFSFFFSLFCQCHLVRGPLFRLIRGRVCHFLSKNKRILLPPSFYVPFVIEDARALIKRDRFFGDRGLREREHFWWLSVNPLFFFPILLLLLRSSSSFLPLLLLLLLLLHSGFVVMRRHQSPLLLLCLCMCLLHPLLFPRALTHHDDECVCVCVCKWIWRHNQS